MKIQLKNILSVICFGFVLLLGAQSVSALTLNEVAKLLASDADVLDKFGYSVAISGNTAVIGARHDDDNGFDSGSAYLFVHSSGVWSQQAKLLASDGAERDWFGISVAVSGNTAVIGADFDDVNGYGSGSAYLFHLTGATTGTVTEDAKLLPSDGAVVDLFGFSVAVSGNTAVIGAIGDADNGSRSGSAYLFDLTGATGTVTEDAKLLPSDGDAGDDFGYSVAVSGNTAVIGAPGDADNGTGSGSAYFFDLTGATGTVTEEAKLLARDGDAGDDFGWSVAVGGNTAVIGAPGDDDIGSSSGLAYIFHLTGATGTVTEDAKLLPNDVAGLDSFGHSVAVSGNTAVIGAVYDTDNGYWSGSAYFFDLTGATGTVTEDAKLLPSDGAELDQFGFSVAVSGNTAVIGAVHDDDDGTNSGSAYIFTRRISISRIFCIPTCEPFGWFGCDYIVFRCYIAPAIIIIIPFIIIWWYWFYRRRQSP